MYISRARRSTDAIEKLYVSMRHLFHRGGYNPSSKPGKILTNLLLEINPEIYGSMSDINKVELNGLIYVLDRLPYGIIETPYICFTSNEGYKGTCFKPIIPPKRRRYCYRISHDQMNIEISRGRSDIYDVLTHLTFLYNESDKIRNIFFGVEGELSRNRVWKLIEDIALNKNINLSSNDREVVIMQLSNLIGRTFEETEHAHNYFSKNLDNNRFFKIIYHMAVSSNNDINNIKKREITFSPTLRQSIGHHIIGEKWANNIKKILYSKGLYKKNIHIISSNMHSVLNIIYAHSVLSEKDDICLYEKLSEDSNINMRNKVLEYSYNKGLIYIKDNSGANINVQIIDLDKVDFTNTIFSNKEINNDIIIVMDYAFGEQAFEVMDELLKPYKIAEDHIFNMNVSSISIMGKAGVLNGDKGDIMIANSHIFEGTTDNYVFENMLSIKDFVDEDLQVYEGPMITVLGTSLQNKDVLKYFKNSSFKAIGLEMEGAHYQKAIQIASKIRSHVNNNIRLLYAYYASDNPLKSGSTLSSGGLGLTGVKPTYLITKKILEKIIIK